MMIPGEKQVETHVGQGAGRLQAVYDYHERSKHRFSGYARGPGALDWDAQPDPFRVYVDAPTLELPFEEAQASAIHQLSHSVSYADALAGSAESSAFSLSALARLLRLAFGITAWKELPDGANWALRANPSSGNLHPTEVWVLVSGCSDVYGEQLKSGLYHYDCRNHALQLRCEWFDADTKKSQLNSEGSQIQSEGIELHIALSTIYWREAWKYGERAFRYCHLDIGHAVAALGFACSVVGWHAEQEKINSDELDDLLGLTRAEHRTVEQESSVCVLRIITQNHLSSAKATAQQLPGLASARSPSRGGVWYGQPNRLDLKPLYTWPLIEQIAAATRVLSAAPAVAAVFTDDSALASVPAHTTASVSAEHVILQRRSAQVYDAAYVMPREIFGEILRAFFETQWQPLLTREARVHFLFAVHNVCDLTPGLYVLARSDHGDGLLRAQLTRWREWHATDISIADRTLYRVKASNTQRAVATLCCQQSIAGACNFTTGFLADFDDGLRDSDDYCALYHEAGSLAHAAYLRATALDLAGTGIGCFFDDEWHDLLGINNKSLQFIYHFAVGKPLYDERIAQRSGYFHLPVSRFSGRRFT